MATRTYNPEKDGKVKDVLEQIDDILGEDFIPLDLQIQRLAHVREQLKARIAELKAQL